MPRISNLQKIKNEALAKLNSLHKIIDGRTDIAFRHKIFATERKDIASKLLNEISSIPTTNITEKKLTKPMIRTKAKLELTEPEYENTIIRSPAEPKVLYKFVIKMKNTYVYEDVDKWITKTRIFVGKSKGYWDESNIYGQKTAGEDESAIFPIGTSIVKVAKSSYNKTEESVAEYAYEMTTMGVKVYVDRILETF